MLINNIGTYLVICPVFRILIFFIADPEAESSNLALRYRRVFLRFGTNYVLY